MSVMEATGIPVGPAGTAVETLARHCAGVRYEDLTEEVRGRTRELILDHLAVTLGGATEESTRIIHSFVRDSAPTGPSSVIAGGMGTLPAWAALANGTASHAIEMDDVTRESSLHPGVAVIPAALAVTEGEAAAPATLIAAVVAGYEVMIRVGNALDPASTYARGFHPTGVAGAFGAAAAAAVAMGLPEAQCARAIGIVGTFASGSLEFLSDGSWSKRLNPGWAAHAGVLAADLARRGFTGPLGALDGRLGALRSYTDAPHPERLTDGLGMSAAILGVSIKPYACCRYNHGVIDGVLDLRERHGLRAEHVSRIRLRLVSAAAPIVAEPIDQKRAPRTVVDAQFSAPFAAAVALVRGAAGLAEYTQAVVDDPTVRSLMAKIECQRDLSFDSRYPRAWPWAVEVDLADGSRLAIGMEHALGDPERPVSRRALVDKFTSFGAAVLGSCGAEVATRILTMGADDDLAAIIGPLRK